jgi:hypothetical protein
MAVVLSVRPGVWGLGSGPGVRCHSCLHESSEGRAQKPMTLLPQTLWSGNGHLSIQVSLDNLDAESLMRLKNSGSLERIRAKVKEIMQQLAENLDSLFFDPIDDRRRSCYVCGSDALHECIRCNKDVCDQHAVFAETEYEEPLTYCNECFDKVIEK